MAEQSLYRRHRPQSFDEVVGQEHVVRTLRNAIERDRVHHAYLFVGSRGTGKTSMAKILARSLNCVQGPTVSPCGVCDSCRTIAAGTSMDVIEMDAASNRSVDDIRELRERVGFAPAAGSWKVYILDEAHMLTREAWNAFLKTLEEPPPNTVFVLATTEPHKVMPTIVDRCQRFDFGRPSPENIAEVLSRVAEVEEISLQDGAIGAIARAANGSFRDALGTLDQLVAYSGSEIATVDVLAVLGVADAELLFGAAEAIAAQDGKGVLTLAADLSRSGRDPSRFAADLVAHLRQLLVIRTTGEVPDHFFVAAEHEPRLSDQAARLDEVALVRAIDELSAAIAAIREGDEARMTIELALLRAARPEIDPSRAALAQRVERLERAMQGAAPAGPVPVVEPPKPSEGPSATADADPADTVAAPPPPAASPATEEDADPRPEPSAGSESGVAAIAQGAVATAEAAAQAAGEAIDLDRIAGLWPAVVEQVRQSGSEFLSAAFAVAKPVSIDPETSTLEVGFPPSAAFNKRKAEDKENRERFSDALRTIVGERLRPVYVMLDRDEGAGTEATQAAEPMDEAALLERFKAEFDAEEMVDDPETQTQEEAS